MVERTEEAKDLNKKLTNEGELLRNKGTNSIKSLKTILGDKFEDVTGVLQSIGNSMALQVKSLDKMVNLNESIVKNDKENQEDKLREDQHKKPSENTDQDRRDRSMVVAMGTFMADMATSLRESIGGMLSKFSNSFIGNIIKVAAIGLGAALIGGPFLQGFFQSAFGIDLKAEATQILTDLKDGASEFLKFMRSLKDLVPSLDQVLVGIGGFLAMLKVRKLARIAGSFGGGLLERMRGGAPKPTVPKSTPAAKPGLLSRMRDGASNLIKNTGSKLNPKSILSGGGKLLGRIAAPLAAYDLYQTGKDIKNNVNDLLFGENPRDIMREILDRENGNIDAAMKHMAEAQERNITYLGSLSENTFRELLEVEKARTEELRQRRLQAEADFEAHKAESAEKFQDNGMIIKGMSTDGSGAIIRERISPAVPSKATALEGVSQDTGAPTIINSFNNTNAPTDARNTVIGGSGGGSGRNTSPTVYTFTSNHMIGSGTMN